MRNKYWKRKMSNYPNRLIKKIKKEQRNNAHLSPQFRNNLSHFFIIFFRREIRYSPENVKKIQPKGFDEFI